MQLIEIVQIDKLLKMSDHWCWRVCAIMSVYGILRAIQVRNMLIWCSLCDLLNRIRLIAKCLYMRDLCITAE